MLGFIVSSRQESLFQSAVYLLEVAAASLLPVHHVMEDGNHDVPQIGLRHQRHLQERTNHSWDEAQLVLPCRRDRGQRGGENLPSSLDAACCFISEAI